jgi:long-chain fatty acid transport protein
MFSAAVLVLLAASLVPAAMAQSGHVLNGVGPIDQAMAGAGMAAPQEALVPVHWNPAAVAFSKESRLDLSIQFMQPTGSIESSVSQGGFGTAPSPPFPPGTPLPPAAMSGSTDSDAGPFPIPALGYVRTMDDSKLAFGLGAMFVGGFGVDYDASPSPFNSDGSFNPDVNPVLTPQQAQGGFGFGAIKSEFALLQVNPTIAYRVSERVSIGFAPTINYGMLEVSPFPAAPPDQTFLFPDGPRAGAVGFGFQVGIHAEGESGLSAGLSIKSPQWFQDFEFTAESIRPGTEFAFNLDYPMIISGGVAYSGLENLLLAADVRYIDFSNTDGFKDSGYGSDFAVQGFGWESIIVAAFGLQYQMSDGYHVRAGYSYNENPLPDELAFFNTPANALIQHRVAGGLGARTAVGGVR